MYISIIEIHLYWQECYYCFIDTVAISIDVYLSKHHTKYFGPTAIFRDVIVIDETTCSVTLHIFLSVFIQQT